MQVFKQWPIYFIGRIFPALIAFGGVALYTRLLDPASFGVYALLMSTSFLFGMTGFSWLRVATIRMMATVSEDETPDFTATIAAAFAGTAIVVAAAIVLTVRIYNPSLPLPLVLVTATTAVASGWFELNIALTQARMKLVVFGVLQATRAICVLGASVLFLRSGMKAEALLCGFSIGNCVAFGMLSEWMPGLRGHVRSEILKRLIKFGWPSSANSLGNCVITVQRYLLGIVSGSAAVGLFAVATDFSTQTIGLLMGTATIAGQPLAFRARDLGEKEQLYAQLRNNARLLFGVGFAATSGIIALAGPIAHTFFGPKFRAGAEPIIIISAITIMVSNLRGSYFEQAFEIALKTRPIAIMTILRMTVTLVLSYFFIIHFGVIGAALSVLIVELAALVVSGVWARTLIRMPLPFGSFTKVIGATIAMVCAIELIPNRTSLLGFGFAVTAGIITYAAACSLMYLRELRSIISMPRVSQAAMRS